MLLNKRRIFPNVLGLLGPRGTSAVILGHLRSSHMDPSAPVPGPHLCPVGAVNGAFSSGQALSCWRLHPQLQPLLEYVSHFYAASHGDLSPLMAQSGNESPCVRGSPIVEDLAPA